MNKYSVENYVDIIENKSSFKLDDMVGVCKRHNNSKRDYLFVNSLQGKHIPVKPSKCLKLFEELTEEVRKGIDKDEKVLVIGFAETATAIGMYIAYNLEQCVYRTQTTRETVYGYEPLVKFEEEHSHAVSQMLYCDIEELKKADRVLFVEDEITTGKTILNFIAELEKLVGGLKYSVASLLNWQDKKDTEVFKSKGIDTFYLVNGHIKDVKSTVQINKKELSTWKNKQYFSSIRLEYTNKAFNFEALRVGTPILVDEHVKIKECYKRISSLANKHIKMTNCSTGETEEFDIETKKKNILVLGTEECMFSGLIIAHSLELDGHYVKYQANTRSPIEPCSKSGYRIKNAYKIRSAYDEDRETYIYNAYGYDAIMIVSDNKITDGFTTDVMNIFRQFNNDLTTYIIEITKDESER